MEIDTCDALSAHPLLNSIQTKNYPRTPVRPTTCAAYTHSFCRHRLPMYYFRLANVEMIR